jgi:hypothetical protein
MNEEAVLGIAWDCLTQPLNRPFGSWVRRHVAMKDGAGTCLSPKLLWSAKIRPSRILAALNGQESQLNHNPDDRSLTDFSLKTNQIRPDVILARHNIKWHLNRAEEVH